MKKILIADDSVLVRTVLKDALQKSNYEVVETDNGHTAVNLAIEELPDLIVLDLVMPKMTGIEAVRNIRSDDRLKHIPVLISTGSDGVHHNFNKGFENSIQGFLEKPYKVDVIIEKIKKQLGDNA